MTGYERMRASFPLRFCPYVLHRVAQIIPDSPPIRPNGPIVCHLRISTEVAVGSHGRSKVDEARHPVEKRPADG